MCRADNLTAFMGQLSWNLGASTSWKPLGLSRPVMGLLYLYGILLHKVSDRSNEAYKQRKHCHTNSIENETHSLVKYKIMYMEPYTNKCQQAQFFQNPFMDSHMASLKNQHFYMIFWYYTKYFQNYRQCTYNVTLMCICVNIVATKVQKHYIFWVCACSFSYPACEALVILPL